MDGCESTGKMNTGRADIEEDREKKGVV